jgi:hypothetical protein
MIPGSIHLFSETIFINQSNNISVTPTMILYTLLPIRQLEILGLMEMVFSNKVLADKLVLNLETVIELMNKKVRTNLETSIRAAK